MLSFVIQHQPHGTLAHFRGKPVRRLAHDGSTFSGVGASGKPGAVHFLADGRICLTNNAAERALRGIALGRKSWLFAGSDRGGERAAVMYTLIQTARLNDVDPQAWLADVLGRLNDHNIHNLDQLLPWNWKGQPARLAA
jgi:hypothetical protein